MKAFYELLSQFYKTKVRKPLPSLQMFIKFFELSQKNKRGKIITIKYNNRIIGGIMCPLAEKTFVHEWYICGLDMEYKSEKIYPSVLATWAGIKYAFDNNIQYFDFMGAGSVNEIYGVRNFKERFGGETILTSRYIDVHKPLMYALGKWALKLGLGAD